MSHKVFTLQKKAIRLISNSSYICHTNPLFIKLKRLKLDDMFKLKLLKTKLMLFHRKQKHIDDVSVIINGTKIERVASFNFLGIMLDENLSWKSHIEMVGNKISKVTGIL